MTRAFAVATALAKRLSRDRASLAVAVLVPLLGVLVLGGAHFGDDPHKVQVVLLDDGTARGPTGVREHELGRAMLAEIDPRVLDVEIVGDARSAQEAVARGEVVALLVLPPSFTQDASQGSTAGLIVVNGADPVAAGETLRELDRAARVAVQSTVPGAAADPLDVETVGGALDAEGAWLVGVVALVAAASVASLALHVVVREREGGTLDRALAATGRASDVVVGHALVFGAVALVQVAVLLAVARALGLFVAGSYAAFALLLVLHTAAVLGAALALGAFVRTPSQGFVALVGLVAVTAFLSGVFWRPAAMWAPLAAVANVVPLGWGLPAARAVAAGAGAVVAALPAAAYVALAALGGGLASWRTGRGP